MCKVIINSIGAHILNIIAQLSYVQLKEKIVVFQDI